MIEKTLTVTLPWPSRLLFPNARTFWANKARVVKRHRAWGYWGAFEQLMAAQMKPAPVGKVRYRIIVVPKCYRNRDEDNLVAACKSYLDGIADAMRVNDKIFTIRGVDIVDPDKSRPNISIELTWDEDNGEQQ